jgi:phosphoglycolate phosphatase
MYLRKRHDEFLVINILYEAHADHPHALCAASVLGRKISPMRYQLAIFDFDGTLADSFPFFLSVFNRVADQHGFKRIDLDRVDSMRHCGTREMMRRVGMPSWKLPLASKTFIALMKENAASIRLFDGIGEALRALADAGVQLAIVSSNSEQNVRQVLGPDLEALVGQYECGMSIFGKAPRIRAVLRHSEIDACNAIYIGDQGTDAEAARKAKVPFGAVRWGYATIEALRQHQPEHEFDSVPDLTTISGQSVVPATGRPDELAM